MSLISQTSSAGFGTLGRSAGLPKYQRAGPSTSLDKRVYSIGGEYRVWRGNCQYQGEADGRLRQALVQVMRRAALDAGWIDSPEPAARGASCLRSPASAAGCQDAPAPDLTPALKNAL